MAYRGDRVPLRGLPIGLFTTMSWSRILTLCLAAGLLGLLTLAPRAILHDSVALTQAVMPIAILGIVGGLLHGFGYRPRNKTLATLFSPWATWTLMLSSLAFLMLATG